MGYFIAAIVVTYNRKALLKECLDALLGQSYPVNKIILIDNASTDGTREFLIENGYMEQPVMNYHLMDCNLGGSGGFYEGLKIAREEEKCDWVWVMDDDTIPTSDCLENLLKAHELLQSKTPSKHTDNRKAAFYASTVYGTSGEFMNLPQISTRPSDNGYAYWYQNLADGIVNIKKATFVSILISKEAVEICGLPCKDYFIWGDDFEYTQRLTTYYGEAYLVGRSVAIHKRVNAKNLSIESENDPKRIKMYHYFYRNSMINHMYYDNGSRLLVFFKSIYNFIKLLIKGENFDKNRTIFKGNLEAVIQYRKFKNYIEGQIKHI